MHCSSPPSNRTATTTSRLSRSGRTTRRWMHTPSPSIRRSSATRSARSRERSSMRGFTRASASLWLLTVAAVAGAQTPAAPPPVATARVVYLEVTPSDVGRAIAALKTYRQATQKTAGVANVAILQQIGRPNLFAIEEHWTDAASLQAHLASADVRKLRDDLQNALVAPIDDRPLAPVAVQLTTRVADRKSTRLNS